jgi:diamine N-acetyltransferase
MIYHGILENQVVCLRALEPADVELLYEWENDISVWLVSSTLVPFSRDLLERYIESSSQDIYAARQLRLMIDARDQDMKTVGMIDLFDFDPQHLRAGIGIMIHPEDQKKQYGREAVLTVINYAFSVLNLHQLHASVLAINHAGLKLFESCGFEITGLKKHWIRTPDGWIDEWMLQKYRESSSL